MMENPIRSLFLALVAAAWSAAPAVAQQRVTSPMEQFGHNLGDDYYLANYAELVEYWRKLDSESDRMILETIGTTAEGRPMLMATVSAPENFANLARYKEISRRLALAEGVTEAEARELAAEGKAVVWIDGGLHATEVLGAQQLMETLYRFVSRDDAETMRLLRDTIVLFVCVNPDGMDLVSNWYMRDPEPERRSTGGLPRLYHKYVGHDNNRDFYMLVMPESEAIARIHYREWFPQIIYNHHQTGPSGTVLFAPPFREPLNHNLDPLITLSLDGVGSAMHRRFVMEGKPGATMRSGANYSTWWNGGLRTTPYFHNSIGLLTETIGNPTPIQIPYILQRQAPSGDLPAPIEPTQVWRFRQSVDYSVTANYAVLDYASRYRDQLLFNIWRMGMNSIERGRTDTWTVTQRTLDAAADAGDDAWGEVFRDPARRDARAYVLPADQVDFPTAVKFVNVLVKGGVAVHRATAAFEADGRQYPAGSFVVRMDQAYRPHLLDMFEPQVHPDDIPFPGAPPIAPYDSAGYTVAFQMGVAFDRTLEDFEAPLEKIEGFATAPMGRVIGPETAAGYLIDHRINDAAIAMNRLLKAGEAVYWLKSEVRSGGATLPPGTIYVADGEVTRARLQGIAADLGFDVTAVAAAPTGPALKLRPVRVGLWDQYGGSMPSGWARWVLEKFEFDYEIAFAPILDRGNLRERFDSLVFIGGGVPRAAQGGGRRGGRGGGGRRGGRGGGGQEILPTALDDFSRLYIENRGETSADATVPNILEFMRAGGSVVTDDSSAALGEHAGIAATDHLVEPTSGGGSRSLPREKYYVPGSVLRVKVDNTQPIAYGLPEDLDVYFNNNPVFRPAPEAAAAGARPVAWFDSDAPLRSGWAWGQHYLKDGVAMISARVGEGHLLMSGPEITFRAQPHGTFKLLFNGIFLGGAEEVTLGSR